MKKPSRLVVISSATAVIAAGILAGYSNFSGRSMARADSTASNPLVDPQSVVAAQALSEAFEAVHRAVANSVVNIDVIKQPSGEDQTDQQQSMPDIPPGLRDLLPPGFQGPQIRILPQQPEQIEGTGSGVIISSDGYIVTNNHVAGDSSKITVTLADGTKYSAKVIGVDPKTDLAVIKIDAKDLQPAVLGDSDQVEVGQWVCAFGSPFGLSQTMTQGIISATGRTDVHIIADHNPQLAGLTYEDFLQTDAPINPGNSGGALVDLEGHVIGINTAIASDTGGSNGIGFSIPSNEVKYVADTLIKYGHVVRGYLGISIDDIHDPNYPSTPKAAKSFGYTGDRGVFVEPGINPDSAAAKGGLKDGDVITKANGQTIEDINQLRNAVANTHPGDNITLEVSREGKTVDLTFPVGTQPDTRLAADLGGNGGENGSLQSDTASSKSLGVTVSDMSDSLQQQYNLEGSNGVVVTSVDPNGVAASVGIEPGDVILKIQDQDVDSASNFNTALSKFNLSDGVRMVVRTPDGNEMFVFLQSGNGQ
jgi:serine protease Do